MDEANLSTAAHLMRFVAEMVANNILTLSVLKVLDFGHLEKSMVFPLQLFFAHLLTHYQAGEQS